MTMTKLIPFLSILISAAAISGSAAGQAVFSSGETATTVIELFTSEGCSSCPPADQWISRLKDNPTLWKKIVPAVFHVNYWDNLGWPDRFATPEFTQRQRRYAKSWPDGTVYTPSFVINGREWRGFFDNETPPAPRPEKPGVLALRLNERREVEATFTPEASARGPFTLEFVWLGTDISSEVTRGENSGRKLHHDFVVLHLASTALTQKEKRWTGSISSFQGSGSNKPSAIAAWVTLTGNLTPIQATGGWLTPSPVH